MVASWMIEPEPADDGERAALLAAAEDALAPEPPSLWWRSGLDDLSGGPADEETGRDLRLAEP